MFAHSSALTGLTDRPINEEPQREEPDMAVMDILNQMGKTFAANIAEAPAGIAAAVGRETLNIRDQIVVLMDTRLQTTAVYPRSTPAQERVQAPEPPGPPPPAPDI